MNNKQKINRKILTISLLLSSFIFGLSSQKILATNANETSTNDTINIKSDVTTVITNMLDENSSLITKASVNKIEGQDQTIKATFESLPDEKIFAVLVDEAAGGAFQFKFLDKNNSVEFKDVKHYVNIPGIHLYKQSSTDPDFLIRPENFIASTSYLMPYVQKVTNTDSATACKADGSKYDETVPKAKLDSTTDPQIYSLIIPKDFFSKIENGSDVTAKNVLAAVISYSDDNYDKKPLEVKQWVSSDYTETENTCKFDFLVPAGTKNILVHLYKDGLYEEKFLCKFCMELKKVKAE